MLTKDKLKSILKKLIEYEENTEKVTISKSDMEKIKFCKSVLEHFEEDYDEWIKYCPFSNQMISTYISDEYIRTAKIDDRLYLLCAKFLREYIFTLERKGFNNTWFSGDWYTFKEKSKELIEPDNQKYLDYLLNGQFDIDLLNHYLGDKSFQAFLNYEKNAVEAEKKLQNIKTDIQSETNKIEYLLKEKEQKVDDLAKKLEEQKIAFNFIGLSKGFENLLSQKIRAKWASFGIMSVFCFLLIALPTVFIGGRFLNWFDKYNIQWANVSWEHLLPVLGLEFVLIYFFRVVLNHYKSIQTQIMQLELRQSLCQFIQSYADYAKEIKEKDTASLEKFENLIFSSILSDSEKVPSTFDGLEPLANLIKNIKSGN